MKKQMGTQRQCPPLQIIFKEDHPLIWGVPQLTHFKWQIKNSKTDRKSDLLPLQRQYNSISQGTRKGWTKTYTEYIQAPLQSTMLMA